MSARQNTSQSTIQFHRAGPDNPDNIAPEDMAAFIGLSALLTGIDGRRLAPKRDVADVKSELFRLARGADPETFGKLLGSYRQAKARGDSDSQAGKRILEDSGPAQRYLARSVMLAWYLGSWYPPAELMKANTPGGETPYIPSTVVSANAYTQGVVWDVAQAHPMGYSNLGYGAWNGEPPGLGDFIDGEAA